MYSTKDIYGSSGNNDTSRLLNCVLIFDSSSKNYGVYFEITRTNPGCGIEIEKKMSFLLYVLI